MLSDISVCKNWIDPFEGIETLLRKQKLLQSQGSSKNWIDPFEGIETVNLMASEDIEFS